MGPYDNETGRFIREDYLLDSPWYEDDRGYLYILVPPEVVAENEGPDNEIMDAVNEIYREQGRRPTDEECEALGLRRVVDVLKRFNEFDGYYHA